MGFYGKKNSFFHVFKFVHYLIIPKAHHAKASFF